MDVEVQQVSSPVGEKEEEEEEKDHMSRRLKWALTILNCLLLLFGTTGAPLLLRLYYLHGGRRQWLPSWIETAGWPVLLLPLFFSYSRRRRHPTTTTTGGRTKLFFMTPRLFLACTVLGLLTGLVDFLYAYGLAFLPVSTSALLISSQLVFTASFAFLIVRQRFTPYSINAVALVTIGAAMLGMHASGDRPQGVSRVKYYLGFFLTLGSAALLGLVLTLVELTYRKARQAVTYTLVIEMQLVMGFIATVLCTVGMLVNKDFKAIPREASNYGLGEGKYCAVLVWAAIFWQMNFLGLIGVIFCVNTLLAGILNSALIPVIEVLAVIFFNEKFNSEKGVALALSLWGLASYSYGEYQQAKLAAATVANGAS